METFNAGWLIVGFIVFIIVWSNPRLRALVILCVVLFLAVAAAKSLLRSQGCGGAGECLVDLQPTWAGPCFPTNGGAVLKTEGRYYLTADAGAPGGATCMDWRFWQ
jgi:hypothetical protein